MAEEKNFIELRSEEVQEILGTPPLWLVRWGTTLVMMGFAFLIAVAGFVRYPDVVSSDKLTITTSDPPVEVVARTDGRVAFFAVHDNDVVAEKQPLAMLQNAARYEDVMRLDGLISGWQKLSLDALRQIQYPDSVQLGDLQADYTIFIRDLEDYKFGKASRSNSVQSNIGSIQMQIKQLEQSIGFDQKSLKRLNDQYRIAEDFYERQKNLFKQGIISEFKLEEERLKLSDIDRQRDALENSILEKNREIINLRNNINSASFGQQETTTTSSTRLTTSLDALRSAVDKWKQTYLISAPIGGKVVFNGLVPQQFVRDGETVLTIVPQSMDKIVGRVQLGVEKSGKVKEGLEVVIKLDNYPYQEFGTLKGKVSSKSLVPKNREYTIFVENLEMSNDGQLLTSLNQKIKFEQQLLGVAEIVTDDKSFLERVLEQVTANFKR